MNYTVELNDAYKTFTRDQDKILPPEETVKRFKDKLKTIDLDILKSAIRIDNGRLDIPVYVYEAGKDCNTPTRRSMGKGPTPDQSAASALMELVELYQEA